jgi:hypothetical protein
MPPAARASSSLSGAMTATPRRRSGYAAMGREFSHAPLAAVAGKPEAELGAALDHLVDAGLLSQQGVPPHANYLFKHALVQDAAYGLLLREPRRALHARIAEALESQFADVAVAEPEMLANHLRRPNLPNRHVIISSVPAIVRSLAPPTPRRSPISMPRLRRQAAFLQARTGIRACLRSC